MSNPWTQPPVLAAFIAGGVNLLVTFGFNAYNSRRNRMHTVNLEMYKYERDKFEKEVLGCISRIEKNEFTIIRSCKKIESSVSDSEFKTLLEKELEKITSNIEEILNFIRQIEFNLDKKNRQFSELSSVLQDMKSVNIGLISFNNRVKEVVNIDIKDLRSILVAGNNNAQGINPQDIEELGEKLKMLSIKVKHKAKDYLDEKRDRI